jgi:hypothetical protein
MIAFKMKGLSKKSDSPLQFKAGMIQWGYEKKKQPSRIQTVYDEPNAPDAAEL